MFSSIFTTTASVVFMFGLVLPSIATATAIEGASSVNVCENLTVAGLGTQLYYPTDASYKAREASYWSVDAALSPKCIVQPRTSAEVALALKTLANSSGKFAIRSGGHSQWAGGSDIADGVTLDLGLLSQTTYNPDTTLASIQPGPRWGDVFATLEAEGVIVAGGRDADVGIGGFLTGGGNSYYTGRMGFGCDSVVNFEVALADGSIVNANKTSNSDLWKALKGGSGNFGIVTRFDMQAFSTNGIWGGMRASNRTYGDQLIDELVKFGNSSSDHPEDAFLINFTYNPSSFTEVVISHVIVDTYAAVDPPAFDSIQTIPTVLKDLKTRTMAEIATTYILPAGDRNVWYTITFYNDARIMKHAAALHDTMVEELLELLGAGNFTTQCLFQPIPTLFAERSVAQGGNVLGMDAVKTNSIMWLGTGAVASEAQEAIIRPKMLALKDGIEEYAKSVNGNLDWVYLNYADGTQSPIPTYGSANVELIKNVSAKYDPNGVFQSKVASGFKISS